MSQVFQQQQFAKEIDLCNYLFADGKQESINAKEYGGLMHHRLLHKEQTVNPFTYISHIQSKWIAEPDWLFSFIYSNLCLKACLRKIC